MADDQQSNVNDVYARVLGRALEAIGSAERLARELGVPVGTLESWLKGQDVPPPKAFRTALRIDALGEHYRPYMK